MYKIKGNNQPGYEVCDKEYAHMCEHRLLKRWKSPTLISYTSNLKDIENKVETIPSGIEQLDRVLGGGFKPGVYIFGANPGLGKTSLMLHILIGLAMNKQHSLLFNLEMSPFQIQTKLLSNYSYRMSLSNLDINKMTINELSSNSFCYKDDGLKEDVKKLCVDYSKEIDKYINIISKSEDYNDIENRRSDYVECIETALINYGQVIKETPVVVIDFLQLLKLTPNAEDKQIDRRLEMNDIIEKLKHYSNVYNAPIILISSLSRNAYTKEISDTENIDYNLSVFKESGQIEYQADFLALLSKGKKIVNFGGEDQNTINISVLKTRYSPYVDETFSLVFKSEYSFFEEANTERK